MKRLVLPLLVLLLLIRPCLAADGLPLDDLEEFDGLSSALSAEETALTGELSLDGSYDGQAALRRVWERLRDSLLERLREEVHAAGELLAIAVLCALAQALCPGKGEEELVDLAGCCAAALLLIGDLDGQFQQAAEALTRLSDYSKASLPAIYTAAAAAGALSSAPVRFAASSLAMDVLISAGERLILPLIRAYTAVSLSACLFPSAVMRSLGRMVKWAAVTAMSALTLVFTGYLSLSGLIAGSTDALALKTAKSVLSGTLPVVGGILSDAASTVLSAAALIRSCAGVFALIGVCALCVTPVAVLLARYLILRAAAAAVELVGGGRLSRLTDELSGVLGMLLGLVGCCSLMLFISIAAGIRTVSP